MDNVHQTSFRLEAEHCWYGRFGYVRIHEQHRTVHLHGHADRKIYGAECLSLISRRARHHDEVGRRIGLGARQIGKDMALHTPETLADWATPRVRSDNMQFFQSLEIYMQAAGGLTTRGRRAHHGLRSVRDASILERWRPL